MLVELKIALVVQIVRVVNVLYYFAGNTGKRDRPIVGRIIPIT